MKLFGKDLFNFKKEVKETKLYDFAQHGMFNEQDSGMNEFIVVQDTGTGNMTATPKKKRPGRKPTVDLTAKGVFECKSLNNNDFKIITDAEYIKQQVADAKDKLSLLPARKKRTVDEYMFGGQRFAVEELHSIIERMQNRAVLSGGGDVLKVVEKYPHTSNTLIAGVIAEQKHLRCKNAGEFVPDFPKDAIDAMKEYNEMCQRVCHKDTNFYVIADKKDFGEVAKRRDPILLAQSPFGFFWQILGAWDEEMIYLGDL